MCTSKKKLICRILTQDPLVSELDTVLIRKKVVSRLLAPDGYTVTEYTLLTPPPLRNFYQKKKSTNREKCMSEWETMERGQPYSRIHENFLSDMVQVRLD